MLLARAKFVLSVAKQDCVASSAPAVSTVALFALLNCLLLKLVSKFYAFFLFLEAGVVSAVIDTVTPL